MTVPRVPSSLTPPQKVEPYTWDWGRLKPDRRRFVARFSVTSKKPTNQLQDHEVQDDLLTFDNFGKFAPSSFSKQSQLPFHPCKPQPQLCPTGQYCRVDHFNPAKFSDSPPPKLSNRTDPSSINLARANYMHPAGWLFVTVRCGVTVYGVISKGTLCEYAAQTEDTCSRRREARALLMRQMQVG